VEQIRLAQDRDRRLPLVNRVMNLRVLAPRSLFVGWLVGWLVGSSVGRSVGRSGWLVGLGSVGQPVWICSGSE
jgi:hypothetical protein